MTHVLDGITISQKIVLGLLAVAVFWIYRTMARHHAVKISALKDILASIPVLERVTLRSGFGANFTFLVESRLLFDHPIELRYQHFRRRLVYTLPHLESDRTFKVRLRMQPDASAWNTHVRDLSAAIKADQVRGEDKAKKDRLTALAPVSN